MINFLKISFLISIASCTQPSHGPLLLRKSNSFYKSSGVVQYFLSELPNWANSPADTHCTRNFSVRYFNIKKVMSSFNLSYFSSVQLQLLFNISKRRALKKYNVASLPAKDEEKIFYQSLDKIRANIFPVNLPKYKRVNVVWVDTFLDNQIGIKKLKNLMGSSSMLKGHPVWLSSCLGYDGLNAMIAKYGLESNNIRLISMEMFSPFSSDGELSHKIHLNLDHLFKKNQKKFFYYRGTKPYEIKGYDYLKKE